MPVSNSFYYKFNQAKSAFTEMIAPLLILLFSYAAISKLLNYDHSKRQMLNQVFPHALANILVWAVPLAELTVAVFLIIKKLRLTGLYFSLGLMILFTGYIALILLNVFNRVPCSCGGVLEHMGWHLHLFFNLFFLALNVIALISIPKKGGIVTRKMKTDSK